MKRTVRNLEVLEQNINDTQNFLENLEYENTED